MRSLKKIGLITGCIAALGFSACYTPPSPTKDEDPGAEKTGELVDANGSPKKAKDEVVKDEDAPLPHAPREAGKGPVFIKGPAEGDVQAFVKDELDRALAEDAPLLVYVGADWCEPCTRFHDAVAAGELDQAFPNLRLVEFDAGRDISRLKPAGYTSRLVPLFAAPGPDGSASGRSFSGSVKGPGAVDNIVPRLEGLLRAAMLDRQSAAKAG